jgi:YVTN family beta-propeller protein
MKVNSYVRLALAFSIVMSAAYALAGSPAGGYHLLKKVPFGAAPGLGATGEYFDYVVVDSAARRVYLSHRTELIVVNADSGEKVGTVTGDWKRMHGVALSPETNHGFITDGDAGNIIMFDIKTFKVLSTIKGEEDADWILYEPVSKRIFAFNGSSKSATVIDPAKGEVIKTIALGGQPEQAVADGKGMIYDNIESTNEVIAFRIARFHYHGSQDAPAVCRRAKSQDAGNAECRHGKSDRRTVPHRRPCGRQYF